MEEFNDSIIIKSAETDEELCGRGYVHCTAWQEAYRGIVCDHYLDTMTVEATTARARNFPDNTLVAKDKDKVVGACPAGWRLPTKAELVNLSDFANDVAEGGFADLDNTDKVLNFNVDFLGYYNISAKKPMGTEANFWSSDAADSDEQAWGLVIVDNDNSSVETSNKAYAYTIRCVKDAI